jgi:hypothetical protein
MEYAYQLRDFVKLKKLATLQVKHSTPLIAKYPEVFAFKTFLSDANSALFHCSFDYSERSNASSERDEVISDALSQATKSLDDNSALVCSSDFNEEYKRQLEHKKHAFKVEFLNHFSSKGDKKNFHKAIASVINAFTMIYLQFLESPLANNAKARSSMVDAWKSCLSLACRAKYYNEQEYRMLSEHNHENHEAIKNSAYNFVVSCISKANCGKKTAHELNVPRTRGLPYKKIVMTRDPERFFSIPGMLDMLPEEKERDLMQSQQDDTEYFNQFPRLQISSSVQSSQGIEKGSGNQSNHQSPSRANVHVPGGDGLRLPQVMDPLSINSREKKMATLSLRRMPYPQPHTRTDSHAMFARNAALEDITDQDKPSSHTHNRPPSR